MHQKSLIRGRRPELFEAGGDGDGEESRGGWRKKKRDEIPAREAQARLRHCINWLR